MLVMTSQKHGGMHAETKAAPAKAPDMDCLQRCLFMPAKQGWMCDGQTGQHCSRARSGCMPSDVQIWQRSRLPLPEKKEPCDDQGASIGRCQRSQYG